MILKVQLGFNDSQAELMGTEPEIVWGTFFVDLREIAGFGEYVINGETNPDITEIVLKNIGGRVIKMNTNEFASIMEKVWGKIN